MRMKRMISFGLIVVMVLVFAGCGGSADTVEDAGTVSKESQGQNEDVKVSDETLTDDQAVTAIKNYCYKNNLDLENIVNEGEYQVYWEISSSDDNEIVVLYRSYTSAEIRYYIDRNSGETYVTEFMPGISDEEERTDESFNVREYL